MITRKTVRIIEIILGITITTLFVIVFSNYNTLENEIMGFVESYGYLSVFIVAFLTDLLPQPIGPELPLITGIYLKLNLGIVFWLAWAGSTAASMLGYHFGKEWGETGLKKLYGENKYEKWNHMYRAHGKLALVIAALSPIPYVPFCWISGIFNMSRIKFFIYGIIPRALRLAGAAYLTITVINLN